MKVMRLVFVVFTCLVFCSVTSQNLRRDTIITLLKEAYQRDQNPRKIIDSLMRSGIVDSNKYLPAIELQEKADNTNLLLIPPLIDEIFEHQIYDLDSIAYKACWTIIQHAPDSILHKYESFIKQLVAKKLISVKSYMAYVDRGQVRQSKAQIYGWQFKRFSTGLIIQYPILNAYKDRWHELGYNYEDNNFLSNEYGAQYNEMTCIGYTQFAVLGVLNKGTLNSQMNLITPLSGVSISIDGVEVGKTDSNGFFRVIINKRDLPVKIKFMAESASVEYMTMPNKGMDYVFLTGFVTGKAIDIIEE